MFGHKDLLNYPTVSEGAKPYEGDWQAWDKYVDNHPQGTVFHTSRWLSLIQSSFDHAPRHTVFKEPTGEIRGVLPLFFVRSKIFGRMLVSTPQAAYGGIIADNESIGQALLSKAQNMARNENVQFLELRNFQKCQEGSDLLTKDLYVTFRLELCSDPEKVFLSIPRKTRAECREGIKKGLEFRIDEIGVDGFYRIYSQNVRDLGTPVFSKKLFAAGPMKFGKNCKIFSVHWQGKAVAAVWTLFYKDEVIPYYGGSLKEYNHLGVNNFMYWMLIRYGCENGYRIYDFGRSKKGSGSFNFKKRWGMIMTDLPYRYFLVRKRSMPDTSPLNASFSLGIRLWRKLPLPIANAVGPLISKHLI